MIKWSTELVQRHLDENFNGYEILGEFEKVTKKITLRCPKGHIQNVRFDSFQIKKTKCLECENAEKNKVLLKQVNDSLSAEGYKLIEFSPVESTVQCDNNHEPYKVKNKNWLNGSRCFACVTKENGKAKRLSYDDIKDCIEQMEGYKLLSTEYIDNKAPLEIKCSEGHIYTTSFRTARKLKGCPICNNYMAQDFKAVKDWVTSFGFNLLTTEEDFKIGQRNFLIKCKNGHVRTINRCTLNRGGDCYECSREKYRGANNPKWKGGISNLSESLREYTKDWKRSCLIESNFTCDITGVSNYTLEVHHLVQFSDIVSVVFNELKLDLKETIFDYANDDRNRIIEKLKSYHTNGIGVVLDKSVHTLFHQTFGYHNTDVNQYLFFKDNYEKFNNGTFTKSNYEEYKIRKAV